ncbi:NUDIX domain-containing protein, partial [Candidatus Peregrinibacteria bacterium]|nr:NUDIX domain-containing protein [Candidatus Peregrinibacteria bacterium]
MPGRSRRCYNTLNGRISIMVKEISAGIIIYRKTSEGIKFLLLYHGGRYWNFPKGKLDQGEKSFRAALREVKEETGLSSNELRLKEWF